MIWVFSVSYNRADILGFWLRHYLAFADKILVWDDKSTDGTRKILAQQHKVSLAEWPYDSGLDDNAFIEFASNAYKAARMEPVDWCIWADMDEFIYHPDIVRVLDASRQQGYDVVQTQGYNMVGDGLPTDDGRQIWELNPMGVKAPVYSKPVVFVPSCDIYWNRGKHALENCAVRITPEPRLKLLHYRYLGRDYTAMRNAENYARCGLKTGDKGAAWSCAPDYNGEHSAEWAEEAKKYAYNVLLE